MKDLIEEMKKAGWEPNQCQHSDGYEYQTFRRPLPKDECEDQKYLAKQRTVIELLTAFPRAISLTEDKSLPNDCVYITVSSDVAKQMNEQLKAMK